ncbi:hypothetical protein U0D24_21880 [Hafnia paralvei]|uniref:type II toxin-antitoxin system RelB/DinJ family antitoxin n=1 Tax=Hafnia paralvei TaxID=546367 RepID=UPI002FDC0E36
MAKTAVNYKIDEALKRRVDQILEQLDITPTIAITGLYHYIDQHSTLPFIIKMQATTLEELDNTLINLYYGALYHLRSVYDKIPAAADAEMVRLNHCHNQINIFIHDYKEHTFTQTTTERECLTDLLYYRLNDCVARARLCNDSRFDPNIGVYKAGLKMGIELLAEKIQSIENTLDPSAP